MIDSSRRQIFRYVGYVIGCLSILACSEQTSISSNTSAELHKLADGSIPSANEWVDSGPILRPGKPGSWDVRFHGMISPATVIKKNGLFYLYYIGADGDRSTDGGPRRRALGVATSHDGINYDKYAGNPIITFLPHDNEEEGIFSAGATIDEEDNFVLYYSTCDAGNATSENVHCDGRLAISSDGFNFVDKGVVLSRKDRSVWGYGDELFPIGALKADQQWYVFYIAKGSGLYPGILRYWRKLEKYLGIHHERAYWDLGVASGPEKNRLTETKAVLTEGSHIIGGGDPVQLPSGVITQFIVRDFEDTTIEARIVHIDESLQLSTPILTYDYDNTGHATILLDQDTDKWFLYYYDPVQNVIAVKTRQNIAPVEKGPRTPEPMPN